MHARDLPEKWERKASELWPDDRDYPNGAYSENPAADDAWRLRNCAAELRAALSEPIKRDVRLSPATIIRKGCKLSTVLRALELDDPGAALPEQPLTKRWREEINDEPNGEYEEGYRDAVLLFLADLDAQHDEGRELLRKAEHKLRAAAGKTLWIGSLESRLKLADEIRKYLEGNSDG